MASVDWETVSKGAAVVAALAPLAVAAAHPRARTNLKSDLEILDRLEAGDPGHAMVKEYVDAQLTRVYGDAGAWRRSLIFASTTMLLGGAGLVVYALVSGVEWWWYLIGGYLLLAGTIGLPEALRGPASAHPPETRSDVAVPPRRVRARKATVR